MQPARAWLALDQGGQSSRAILYDDAGHELAQAHVPIATFRSGDDRVEHDAEEVLASVRDAATAALAARSDAPWPGAAGLATQRSSIVCWQRSTGRALSPVLSWQDRRAAAALLPLRGAEARVRRLSGLPLSAHYGATKIRWCVENLPAVRDAARHGDLAAGPLATFIASRLLGRATAVDPANASRTQLWDAERGDWSPELLVLFGVEREWLPAAGTTVSTTTMSGQPLAGTPLAVVTGDQSAVPFAWGPPRNDTLFLNLGTGAFLQRPTGTQRPEPGALLGSVLYGDAARTLYSLEGTVNGAASALEWFATQEGIELEDAWRRWEATTAASRAASALLFLNGISGLGSPYWRGDFGSRFLGEGTDASAGDTGARFAALVASIAYLVRVNFDELLRAGPISRVIVTGGLARSDGLVQLIADLCGVRLLRPSRSEATSLGILGLLLQDRGLACMPGEMQAFDPDTAQRAQAGFGRWRDAMHEAVKKCSSA